VVILDEVDQLEDKKLLYELYRTSGLALVLIANDQASVFGDVTARVSSRFQTSERIEFRRYPLSELVSILEDRAKWGLEPESVSTSQLETIADTAAGDARVAIAILRNASKKAARQDIGEITDSLIEESIPAAKSEIRQQNLDKLTADQQVIYEIIAEAGEIAPRDLYEAYRERTANPKTDRTVRNYLEKMERYNLVVADGENRGRTYVLQE
jgi:Cdc6-like AAA superfamily ATPase